MRYLGSECSHRLRASFLKAKSWVRPQNQGGKLGPAGETGFNVAEQGFGPGDFTRQGMLRDPAAGVAGRSQVLGQLIGLELPALVSRGQHGRGEQVAAIDHEPPGWAAPVLHHRSDAVPVKSRCERLGDTGGFVGAR
jgi:hypothetical protein